MKKMLIAVIAVAVAFSACSYAPSSTMQSPDDFENSSVSSEAPASSIAYSSSSQLSQSEAPTTFSLNTELMLLIGASNKELQAYRSGKCYVQPIGLGAMEISFFNPYLSMVFSPKDNTKIKNHYKANYKDNLYEYSENPLNDEFKIMWIDLMAEYEGEIKNQDSLKLLFNTNANITYDLLCEQLNQQPALSYYESNYLPLTPENHKSDNRQAPIIKVDGGEYSANFDFEGLTACISFVKQGENYVAWHLRMENKAITEKEMALP